MSVSLGCGSVKTSLQERHSATRHWLPSTVRNPRRTVFISAHNGQTGGVISAPLLARCFSQLCFRSSGVSVSIGLFQFGSYVCLRVWTLVRMSDPIHDCRGAG